MTGKYPAGLCPPPIFLKGKLRHKITIFMRFADRFSSFFKNTEKSGESMLKPQCAYFAFFAQKAFKNQ
jgi:hypothetical protein